MALSDLNRPKLRKYSPNGVSQKGRYVTKAKGQSREINPSISNFGRSSNDPWLLAYREPGDLPVIELSGDITSALKTLTDIKTGLGVGRTKFLEDLLESEIYKKKAGMINDVTKNKYTRAEIIAEAKTQYQTELKNLQSAQTLVENHRKSEFNKNAYVSAGRMVDYIKNRIALIGGDESNPLYDKNLTLKDIPGLEKSLESWMRKQQQAENRMKGIDLGGMFLGSQLQDIGERFGEIFDKPKGGSDEFDRKGELGGFRQKLAEKFSKMGNTIFNPNIKFVEVPKRHEPGVVNYFPKPGGVTDLDAMGFTKNMQIGESKFIGISEDGKNYKYPNTLKLNLGMPGNTNDDILAKSYFPGPMGSEELHATGFTKFFIDKTKSQFVGISKDGKSYNYPVVDGFHQGTFRLGIEGGRTVTGLGNADSSLKEGVDYFSGNQRVGADGIHTLPLGFWKNIGKDITKLPHNSRSQLSYMVTEGDLAGKYVFGFGPPTENMAVDSPHMWQLSSKSIIPDVPNTWDVRGQTMWDQMGEYPWAASNQPSLQSKGVNFMAGTKKGKDFNPEDDLHPAGFTTNMGKLNWKTGDPHTGIASKLAIPIDENGDRSKIKISANLDGLDGYDFPYPGQGSWHIRKHYSRRFTPPLHNGAVALGQSGTHFNLGVRSSEGVVPLPNSYSPEDYPIYSSVNLADDDEVTRLNTMIGASTYKVPKIGSELARKFVHPTNAEGGTYGKFGYINHYWEWKNPHKIREEAGHGSLFPIHPIIYKSLLDMGGPHDDVGDQDSYVSGKSLKEVFRYSGNTDRRQGAGPTIEFVRGGLPTALVRVDADLHRLFTLLHDSGNTGNFILGKQALLQALNPREETRVFNPLSFEANATRVVKLQRHISAEGLLNTIKTSIFNPIKSFFDPGSVSPVTLGLYERYEGYDWGEKNRRGKKNKLAQWANESFKSEETADGTFGDKLKKGLLRGLTKSFTSAASSITGYNLEESPDPPSRYVDSQKTLDKKAIHKGTQQRGKQNYKLKQYVNLSNAGNTGYGQSHNKIKGQKVVDDIGHQGKPNTSLNTSWHSRLGVIHPKDSDKIDKINAHRYGDPLPEETMNEFDDERDFIKFRFKDMVDGSNIVFRAILSGINDNITPDWASERYIGRADQVHVYKGADRNISFNFSIAPKSLTEFPFLMEKLNYLIGLCYPDYDKNNSNRMVPPMTQLTIGSLLSEAPGFLNSLSYTVEESSPWETRRGMQFPKFINVSCDFRYIGNKLPSKYGQHFGYDQAWYRDNNIINEFDPEIISLLKLNNKKDPLRQASYASNGIPHPDTLPGPSGNWGGDAAAATTVVEKISPVGATPVPGAASTSIKKQSSGNNQSPTPKKIDKKLVKEAYAAALKESGGTGVTVNISQTVGEGTVNQRKTTETMSGTMTLADLKKDFGKIPGFKF